MSCSIDDLITHFRNQVASCEPMFHVSGGQAVLLRSPAGADFEGCCQALQLLLDDASLSQFSLIASDHEPESTLSFAAVRPGHPQSAGASELQE